jgi:hypothetical protein
MQSAQESLAELRAAIRYCENAISAAESTIESIDFRQQLAKQQAMNKQESTGREVALREMVKKLEATNETLVIDNDNLNRENAKLRKEKEASSGPCGCQAYRDLEEKVATMPVIPRDVAIAIFREGQRLGYNDKSLAENLKGLCEKKGFECRIHGIDDNK